MAPSPQEDLELIARAAHEAGAIALGFFRRDVQVWWKEGNSPVSEADFATNTYLRDVLLAARPGYGWLSEEADTPQVETGRSVPGNGDQGAGRFFVVDPIDGTRSFLRGEDTWCVSIAVIDGGRPVAGVIDAPAKREVFLAHSGGTPTLNGERISASAGTRSGRLHLSLPEPMRRKLGPHHQGSIRIAANAPSLAYRLALVASGRLDGTLIRPRANDWDIAAGDLILELAGGQLVDEKGAARLYKPEGKRHGLLIAGAAHAMPALRALAADVS